ncbi:bifunctional lysylphosphatidylglycerol flippase/synthetase MprF [Enterococcus sp. LJL90]
MEKIIAWFKKRLPVFKFLFLLSVIIVVIFQLVTLSKTITPEQIVDVFQSIPLWKLAVMLVIGLVAILPMLNYDIVLNKLLGQKLKTSFLLESSWSINTINNMVGFGGVFTIGLRTEFFGKEIDGKKLLQHLSKLLLFLMSGLSVFSLVSFILLFTMPMNHYITDYWIWLLGGSLYFPVVLLVTKLKKEGILGGLAAKYRWQLLLTSTLEWAGVLISFLAIGALMDIKVNFFAVIPLFIASSVIGIVSMIPGELGSFDVMMIFGLASLGVPHDVAVTWILLYRLFYYVIPFIIGAVFLFKNLGGEIDSRYNGIPKELLQEIAHKVLVFALYFSGSMMVLLATIPEAFNHFQWLNHINPWRLHFISQFPSLLLGFLLLVMGRATANRSQKAYLPTLILLALASVYIFFSEFNTATLVFLVLLFVLAVFSKRELYRKQFVYSWESMTMDGLLYTALFILYIAIGIYNLPAFPHHNHHTIDFFLFPSERTWLTGFIAIVVVASIIWLFIKYLQGEKKVLGEKVADEQVYQVLNKYGGNPESQLAFLGDKNIYFYNDGTENTVFLQMNTHNDKCVIMGDPAGKESDFADAIQQLIHDADILGYHPVFYEVSEKLVMLLHEFGYDFIKMGEAAEVDLTTFTISGKKMKGQRATMNRLQKEGYQFEVLKPPFNQETMASLREVSDAWLAGRKEKGFSLGFFSEDYLQKSPISVIKDQTGAIVAFANIMPTYTETIGTIDLMRHNPETAPSGTMDFLFINLFEYMHNEGLTIFDLGMAPLSNVGTSRKSFTQERIAYLVYQFGSHFYSFQGLRDYKEKYAAEWVPSYTAYSRDSWIIFVMSALLIIDNAPVEK